MFEPVADPWQEMFYEKDGQRVARLMHVGTEVHFEILPEYRHKVIFRDVTREFLKPVFDKQGFLTTKALVDDVVNQRFVRRLGFVETWSDGIYRYYMMTALPFEKKEH
jgi:hypothetical protein